MGKNSLWKFSLKKFNNLNGIKKLNISDLIEFSSDKINLVYSSNGSGKSSIAKGLLLLFSCKISDANQKNKPYLSNPRKEYYKISSPKTYEEVNKSKIEIQAEYYEIKEGKELAKIMINPKKKKRDVLFFSYTTTPKTDVKFYKPDGKFINTKTQSTTALNQKFTLQISNMVNFKKFFAFKHSKKNQKKRSYWF